MDWAAAAIRNLVPLSCSSELATALREWAYVLGAYNDLAPETGSCELCTYEPIRYEFLIHNAQTNRQLWVGSECIKRFGLEGRSVEGARLSPAQTAKLVSRDRGRMVSDARRRRLVDALVALAQVDHDFRIESFIDYVQERGAFTPAQLNTLFWRLDKHGIAHNKRDFRLVMRREREKDQLRTMKDWRVTKLLPAMTPSQRTWVSKNRPDVKVQPSRSR